MTSEYLPYFELKEVSDDGTFIGIASVYGAEDLGGDIIDKGAFKKTIAENPTVPILWQHKSDEVIGVGTIKEWQGKILLEGRLDLEDNGTATKAYGKMKRKMIKGLSIGFTTVKHFFEEVETRSIRHISELKLWEVSVVTFPMLPSAQITRVKNVDEDQDRRIAALEATIQALKAQATTPVAPEPVQPVEPPTQETPEPVVDHSGITSKIESLRSLYHGS